MKLRLEPYQDKLTEWPKEGQHIMAQYDENKIVVYQSYRPETGNFAVENHYFGGDFSLNRMTWIKPNFLWMMCRNGWGTKVGQEVVLAIHLKKEAFINYLKNAEFSSFQPDKYVNRETWKALVKSSSVRLQWDPDHNPYGEKLARRAIQIGLRNQVIKSYSQSDILLIEDISDFVKEQHRYVLEKNLNKLLLPRERRLIVDGNLAQKLCVVE